MSLKGLVQIEHKVCLRGGALEARGPQWEGDLQHVPFCTLMNFDPSECDTDSKMEC